MQLPFNQTIKCSSNRLICSTSFWSYLSASFFGFFLRICTIFRPLHISLVSCLRVSRFMSNSFARSIRLWPAGSFRFVAFEPFLQLVSTQINKLVEVYRQCYPTSILPSITSFSAFTIVPVNDTLGSCRTEWLARHGNMLISLVVVIDVMTFERDGERVLLEYIDNTTHASFYA